MEMEPQEAGTAQERLAGSFLQAISALPQGKSILEMSLVSSGSNNTLLGKVWATRINGKGTTIVSPF